MARTIRTHRPGDPLGGRAGGVPARTIKSLAPQVGLCFAKKRLQSVAKDTRVKVLATKGVLKQIQIVDGADTGKTGWIAASQLVHEA